MTNEPGTPLGDHDITTRPGPEMSLTPALPRTAMDAHPQVGDRLHDSLVLRSPRPGAAARGVRVCVVCMSCDLINHVAAEEFDQDPACEHCGMQLFQHRAFDLEEANFDLHVHASHVPVVVVFWAPWCRPCDSVLRLTDHAARMLEPRLRFARVNTDKERELVMRHGIRGIPTLLLFRRGKEAARRIGAVDLRAVKGWATA